MTTYSDYLFEGTAETGRILMRNRVTVCRNQPKKAAILKKIIDRMVIGGMENIIRNSGVERVFLFDPKQNAHCEAVQGADGICFWSDDVQNAAVCRCCIGLSTDAFLYDEDYVALVFLHEMVHGFLRFGENHHNATFHNELDHLIMQYNAYCGGNIQNDYNGLPESERDMVPLFGK